VSAAAHFGYQRKEETNKAKNNNRHVPSPRSQARRGTIWNMYFTPNQDVREPHSRELVP